MLCYTIGHSNHSLTKFMHLLRIYDIDLVADVRSVPYSRYVNHFNQEALSACLKHNGILYRWLGQELGGDRIHANTSMDDLESGLIAIQRLTKAGTRVALMCSEKDPLSCHRFLALTPLLTSKGLIVRHIYDDGTDIDTGCLEDRLVRQHLGDFYQLNLFSPVPSRRDLIRLASIRALSAACNFRAG